MTAALHPAGRFYAAFHRWSCSTGWQHVQPRACHPSRSATHRTFRPASTFTSPVKQHGVTSDSRANHEETRPGSVSDTKPSVPMKTSLRKIMRHVPTNVAIITARTTLPQHEDKSFAIGSAISSLTTVTLDPPHVSFNIKNPSRTLDAIHEAGGHFRVHFLDNSPRSASIAQNFTQLNSPDILRERMNTLDFAHDDPGEKSLPPRLQAPCVLASMTCQMVQEVTVADHIVAIASVSDLWAKEKLEPALLYNEGSYKEYTGAELCGSKDLADEGSASKGSEKP